MTALLLLLLQTLSLSAHASSSSDASYLISIAPNPRVPMHGSAQLRGEWKVQERLSVPVDVNGFYFRPWLASSDGPVIDALGLDIPINCIGISSGVHRYLSDVDGGVYIGVQAYLDRYAVSDWAPSTTSSSSWWTVAAAPNVGWKWVNRYSGLTLAADVGVGGRRVLGERPDLHGAEATGSPVIVTGGLWVGFSY